jgi:steroid 5-alpha reductase family enzyme
VTSVAVHPFLTGLALTLAVSLALFVVSWLVAVRVGRFNVVDIVWGMSFIVTAIVSFFWSAGHDASTSRRVLILVLVTVWGGRLSGYIAIRSRGKGEDPRYTAMLGDRPHRALRALGSVFVLQAIVAWFISLPVQAAMYIQSGWVPLAYLGVAVWAVGVFFESVGDAQMAAFRNDPANTGTVMDRGLWRYTRHPNYFGDFCVWWGVWLVALTAAGTWWTAIGPLVMTVLLMRVSGAARLERDIGDRRPKYADYIRRTSAFFPRPPQRR